MATNKLVRDYLGNLVPKAGARKIMGKYYVEGETCFLMEDDQWYRITSTDKIIFDHYLGKYVLKTGSIIKGIVNSKGDDGFFSSNPFLVTVRDRVSGRNTIVLNEKVAESIGYIESVSDGVFYKKDQLTDKDTKDWFNRKNIPNSERSKDYNLESNREVKSQLIRRYEEYPGKISAQAVMYSQIVGDFTIGAEIEVINGFLPSRIRHMLGIAALKDGSLRTDTSEGIEYCTVPMKGSKGIQVLIDLFRELSKRCEVNNYCALHYHFGGVRKDKIYTLSLYRLVMLLQDELASYFPYSRFNSIKADGKIYCRKLQDLGIDYTSIMKSKDEDEFHERVVNEFNKIYRWLNNGKGLAENIEKPRLAREVTTVNGKKMFRDVWLKKVYSTKTINHSVQGQKWDKPSRYFIVNFLNLYFNNTGTIEFRPHESTLSADKALMWLAVCASIIRYAENTKKCLTAKSLTLKEVLSGFVNSKELDKIMTYLKFRHDTFFDAKGAYRDYKSVEAKWFKEDPNFKL
jgi:hypothetical protein